MAHWNHRVIKRTIGDSESFGIHEVYYNDDGSVEGCTIDPVAVDCDTLDDLRETLERMLRCLDKPVLVDGEIKFSGSK
jgi:hypothetical protein